MFCKAGAVAPSAAGSVRRQVATIAHASAAHSRWCTGSPALRYNGQMNQVELAGLARALLDKQGDLSEVTRDLIVLSSNDPNYDAKRRVLVERRTRVKADVDRLEEELEKAIRECGYYR